MATELLKADRLREGADKAVMIFHGLPLENWGTLFCWDMTDGSAGISDYQAQWCDNDYGRLNICVNDNRSDRGYYAGGVGQHELYQRLAECPFQTALGLVGDECVPYLYYS